MPVGVALFDIILNWNTYYVGSATYNLAFYQAMAKAHELTIQASLAAIVFSLVGYEMVLGEGIPFGALFSGLQINQISYLWSMEFWGSTRSRQLSIQRKGRLLGVVFVGALLATASGPSSAVLLIPRVQFWPAGSIQIWVNGTFNDLWPDRVVDQP